MPANMAHFFIAETALDKYRLEVGKNDGFGKILGIYKNFFLLGSIGPDIPNYKTIKIIKRILKKQELWRPVEVDGWSYLFHSVKPNEMAAALFNIIMKDTQSREWDIRGYSRLAFATGWLCHIATDRIIHPYVNAYAGNYYASVDNTKKHMHCEVEQDIWCYAHYKGNGKIDGFFNEEPEKWIELKYHTETKKFDSDEEEAFIYYLIRAIAEGYSVIVDKDEVKAWLDGIRFAIGKMDDIGPIRSMAKKCRGEDMETLELSLSECVTEDFIKKGIPKAEDECYRMIKLAKDIFRREEPLAGEMRKNFLEEVGDADLTNPPY